MAGSHNAVELERKLTLAGLYPRRRRVCRPPLRGL